MYFEKKRLMKKTLLFCCAAAIFMTACNSGGGDDKPKTDTGKTAEVKSDAPPSAIPDSATMMKNRQSYMTPGDIHKMMASWDGNWDGEVTMWSPGQPEQKSTSKAINKMVMGGRYQVSDHKGNMMGMPFEGMSTLAYDNAKKVFISTWIDNMGSGMMVMQGPWDAATKTISLTGKSVDPATLTERDYRETFAIIDDNTQLLTMYGPGMDGKEMKMMEIKFTRKK